MKIQYKLLVVLAVTLLLSFISFFITFHVSLSEQSDLKKVVSAEVQQNIQKLMGIQSESLKECVNDYTYWDEMVAFVTLKDEKWAKVNLFTMLQSYKINSVWVFDTLKCNTYFITNSSNAFVPRSLFNSSLLFETLNKYRYVHTFYYLNATLIEVVGATIHPSSDFMHKTKPRGYFFIARAWNAHNLSVMEQITATKISLVKSASDINSGENTVLSYIPIYNCNGERICYLQSEKELHFLNIQQKYKHIAIVILLLSAIVILTVFLITVTIWVYRPLHLVEAILLKKDGSLINKLKSSGHEFRRIGLLIQNMANKNEQLKMAKDKAEMANKLKTRFLCNINHEIRTPINGIIGFSDLLIDLPSDELVTKQEYAGFIKNNCNNLINIINDIIDISLIETKKVVAVKMHFNLHRLINSVLSENKQIIENSGKENLSIKVNLSAVAPECNVFADKPHIERVLNILVGNAIKFTHSGYIEIGAESVTANNITLYVKDTGIGIANEKLNVIFENFRQADESFSRNYGGNGLGLAICKGFVNAMDGHIWVKSEPNRGSVFFVSIPVLTTINFC